MNITGSFHSLGGGLRFTGAFYSNSAYGFKSLDAGPNDLRYNDFDFDASRSWTL